MTSLLLLAFALAGAQPPPAPVTAPEPPRQLFLLLFRPGPAWRAGVPMAQQDLRDHAAYHARLVREGRSVAGGGYVGIEGGMAIVRAADRAEAEAMLAADPAIRNGVFAADLRQWTPRFHSDAPLVERPRP
ncbi:MAG TPA: YciI family protein [Allosphingosinicella sp.]|nr:YciI family protein [Allosphingosinicella sp.]